ncbi:MAG TPA: sigma-70 family RNA polymerase sigma factor [Acidimicrobiales bacterium]
MTTVLNGSDVDTLHLTYHETGDAAARDALVARYEGLARSIALRASKRSDETDDLVQVALYGLLRALERFDPHRGFAFSTFAHATIVGELKRYRRSTAWVVHIPRRLQEAYMNVHAAAEELAHELGRQGTITELAQRAGVDEDDVIQVLDFGQLQRPASLEQPTASTGRLPEVPAVEAGFDHVVLGDLLARLLAKLPARERRIVEMRFIDGRTQSEIAEEIGISQMHVSRLLRGALDRMRVLAADR